MEGQEQERRARWLVGIMTSRSISLGTRPPGHRDAGGGFSLFKGFLAYMTIGLRGAGMGFLCRSGIYFIKYTTIGNRGNRIGFICEGFTWYTTIGHGDDGMGFICEGFTWYTTIGHGDDGIGFLCSVGGY